MSPLQMSALIPGPEIVPETTDAGEGTEDAVATHVGLEPVALPPQPIAAAPISETRDGTLARETGTVCSIRRFHGAYPNWSRKPPRVIGEVVDWQGHSPAALKAMKDGLETLRQQGVEPID